MTTWAYQEGYAAYDAGTRFSDNPNGIATTARIKWHDGWLQAQQDEIETSVEVQGDHK